MTTGGSELESTLRHIADDRTASPEDRRLAKDILSMLPELLSLSARGFGELYAYFHEGQVWEVKETRKRKIGKSA
jgi:hypothetical protein